MSGSLTVVGLGPGDERFLTQEAENALAAAEALYGYRAYLDRVPARDGQTRHGSDNREEAARARTALHHAAKGANVVVVSGGDPGVFAMAASVCEEIEAGPDEWRRFDVKVVPGITAMLAVAARAGAPLGHDFCAISLSDNLKPWELIERASMPQQRRASSSRSTIPYRRRGRGNSAPPSTRLPRISRHDAGDFRPRGRASRGEHQSDDAGRGRPASSRHGDAGHRRLG